MDSKIKPIDQIKNHIRKGQNFVLQGGAGSGKTETLKEIIEYIAEEFPAKKIACITHTNLAVDEIKSRVGEYYTISTIHSFLNSHIKDYKKNIHQVIFEIFRLDYIERKESSFYADDEKEQNKAEHKKYKKIYEKYAKKLFSINKESMPKVLGKREYDKNPEKYNKELNAQIKLLNAEILQIINDTNCDNNNIKYNETRFDSFKDLTFGHDGLLDIASLLFEKHMMLRKILQDKFDYIFIDEYQDTNEKIINVFLDKVANKKTTIGLFGDSMQGIYDSGIGEVEEHIEEGKLVRVKKEDNYRCSEQVIDFINQYRNDGIKQDVALKKQNGIVETLEQRQGLVKLYYANYSDKRPSSIEEKEEYSKALITLLKKVEHTNPDFKKLMLTNKAIAGKVGFKILYDIFNARYFDVKDEIEKDLTTLQLMDLAELYNAYEKQNYNFVLTELKKSDFVLKKAKDKVKIKENFDKIINSDISAIKTLKMAFELGLLKKTESYSTYIDRKDSLLKGLEADDKYQNFKVLFNEGHKTFVKMSKVKNDLINDEFDELSNLFKKEKFYLDFFSDKLKFQEIINYHKYLNEETEYITMHKTKGSGIENVLVVLDEFFWTEYDFKTIFNPDETDITKKNKNQKLFYVACSRAIKNLICVKLINTDEKTEHIKNNFSNIEEVSIT